MTSSLMFYKYFSNPGLTVSGSEMAFLSVWTTKQTFKQSFG